MKINKYDEFISEARTSFDIISDYIEMGDIDNVKRCYENKKNTFNKLNSKRTPLSISISYYTKSQNNKEIFKYIFNHIRTNISDKNNIALSEACYLGLLDIFKMILNDNRFRIINEKEDSYLIYTKLINGFSKNLKLSKKDNIEILKILLNDKRFILEFNELAFSKSHTNLLNIILNSYLKATNYPYNDKIDYENIKKYLLEALKLVLKDNRTNLDIKINTNEIPEEIKDLIENDSVSNLTQKMKLFFKEMSENNDEAHVMYNKVKEFMRKNMFR